jgi:hypothetical protein
MHGDSYYHNDLTSTTVWELASYLLRNAPPAAAATTPTNKTLFASSLIKTARVAGGMQSLGQTNLIEGTAASISSFLAG